MNTNTIDPVEMLEDRFRDAIARAFPEVEGADPLISASRQANLGDFQSNAAMPLAKRVGMKPRDVAQKLVEAVDLDGVAEPLDESSIAGPGFINMRLDSGTLARLLTELDTDAVGVREPAQAETVVVDVCGVNLAKRMHVGHLRASCIGDSLARLFERLGHTVVRQNHVGDWGLPIAMVTAKLIEESEAGRVDLETLTLDALDAMYKDAQLECAADHRGLAVARKYDLGPKAIAELESQVESAEERLSHAKDVLIKLQSGEPSVKSVWQKIYDVTMSACLAACERLHTRITDEASAGESSYADELAGVVDDLESRGVAEASDGALVVRVEGIAEPCLIRKRDGGFLYATTDMAAIRRRVQKLGGDRLLYCVDARQGLHFRQVFGAATKAGYATKPGRDTPSELQHAAFGTILGPDNKPFKTRSGESVKLQDLLDEAVARAGATVAEKNPDLDVKSRAEIAEAVGIAAIKYTDLSSERIKDYVFDFDRMLAFEGNTGPYLLYALTRTRSIERRAAEAGISAEVWRDAEIKVDQPEEKTLALTLLRYPRTLESASATLEPHKLCGYAYDLATAYSVFYDRCPVLRAETEPVRNSRLRLCALTGRVLADVLETLGLPTVERM